MIRAASPILDWHGNPFPTARVQPRFTVRDLRGRGETTLQRARGVQASYDAARDGVWLSNHWANADALDADSAHSPTIRKKLRERSRYEAGNNGYYSGALRTWADYLVGTGPKLRMQTGSTPFNRMVEREFHAWAKAVGLYRKLRCMAHAKVQDGEAIAVLRTNPGVAHPVQLDVVLYETEQFSTPYLGSETGRIDGLDFDQFGNPQIYHRLLSHPGNGSTFSAVQETEQIPARFVLHWLRLERPGQHRGVPDCSPTLNLGAAHRKVREANVTAAQTAASYGTLLETPMPSSSTDDVPDVAESFTEMTIPNGSIVALPFGNKAMQLDPKHPGPQYEAFQKLCTNEQMRPLSMPYNVAACDSSSYNFASGRLDWHTFFAALDVEREDVNDLILDKLFGLWMREAVRAFGWFTGDPSQVDTQRMAHGWDWPAKPIIDEKSHAFALEKNLANGSTTLPLEYAERGYDFADEMNTLVEQMVDVFGIDEATARARLFERYFPAKAAAGPAQSQSDLQDQVDQLEEANA